MPTWKKWTKLGDGDSLIYSDLKFVKGKIGHERRLLQTLRKNRTKMKHGHEKKKVKWGSDIESFLSESHHPINDESRLQQPFSNLTLTARIFQQKSAWHASACHPSDMFVPNISLWQMNPEVVEFLDGNHTTNEDMSSFGEKPGTLVPPRILEALFGSDPVISCAR